MATNVLVDLLLATRKEALRAMEDLSPEDADRPAAPGLDSLSWVVGHMAMGEDAYWNAFCLNRPRDEWIAANYRRDATATPSLAEAEAALRRVHAGTEEYLRSIDDAELERVPTIEGRSLRGESVRRLLWRAIAHAWVHVGEIDTLRSLLGHQVADFPALAWPEAGVMGYGGAPLIELALATRKELRRSLEGLSAEEAERRASANSVSWLVGHMASAEDAFWNVYCCGKPRDEWARAHYRPGDATIPPYAEALAALESVHSGSEAYIAGLTEDEMARVPALRDGRTFRDETVLCLLRRSIAHHWLHVGEIVTLRSLLGNKAGEFPFNP